MLIGGGGGGVTYGCDGAGCAHAPPVYAVITAELRASRIKMSIGRGDSWRDTNVFYARREGIDATFAIAQAVIPDAFVASYALSVVAAIVTTPDE